MRSFLLAGLVLVIGTASAARGEDARLTKIRKKLEADEKELKAKLADAKDPEDRKAIDFNLKEQSFNAATDALDLANENKKDAVALDAAVFALEVLAKYQLTREDFDKATTLILENHLDSPKIGPALGRVVPTGQKGLGFLRAVSEKATNKEVQGLATYYTALALDFEAGAREGGNAAETAPRLRAEAVELMEKAVKLAPDAKVGDETLAKAAATELVSLRINVGNPVPDVEGADLDGKKVKLSSYRGKVVLLDFWATWCVPCVQMIPHERALVEKLKAKPFALVSVSVDESKDTLTDYLGRGKMPWHHWWDGKDGPVAKMFRMRFTPTLFLIDAKGVVRKKWATSPTPDVLDKAVEELVAEAEKK